MMPRTKPTTIHIKSTPQGFIICPTVQKITGVSKMPQAVNHPVETRLDRRVLETFRWVKAVELFGGQTVNIHHLMTDE